MDQWDLDAVQGPKCAPSHVLSLTGGETFVKKIMLLNTYSENIPFMDYFVTCLTSTIDCAVCSKNKNMCFFTCELRTDFFLLWYGVFVFSFSNFKRLLYQSSIYRVVVLFLKIVWFNFIIRQTTRRTGMFSTHSVKKLW